MSFTGYENDINTGLMFVQARYYMPEIARFTQEDPHKGNIYNPKSLNPYMHCYNNPLNWVDLDGCLPTQIKNQLAQQYNSMRRVNDYAATQWLLGTVMVSANPRDSVHTLGQIFLFDHLARSGIPVNQLELEVRLPTGVDSNRSGVGGIDLLAFPGGNAMLFDVKSAMEMNRPDRLIAAVVKNNDYYNALICDDNARIRTSRGIRQVIPPASNPNFGDINIQLINHKLFDVRMHMTYIGNGIYTYEIRQYRKDSRGNEVAVPLTQDHFQQVYRQYIFTKELEAYNRAVLELGLRIGTIAISAQGGLLGINALLSALGTPAGVASLPVLSSHLQSAIPGFVPGTVTMIVKHKEEIRRVVEEVFRRAA